MPIGKKQYYEQQINKLGIKFKTLDLSFHNMKNGKAKAQFKDFENSIRVKIANHSLTITHALGHLSAKEYDLKILRHADKLLYFAELNNPQLMELSQSFLKN